MNHEEVDHHYPVWMSVALSLTLYAPTAQEVGRAQKDCISPAVVKLKFDLRKLWIDHAIWTRSYLVSRNADDIAKFLSAANPNWSFKELQDLLYTHLKLITDDVTARLKKDWSGSIAAFDKGEDHIIMLADALAKGSIKQFPDKF